VQPLAGKRLNVVGEFPEDMPIPATDFKTVTGRDLLSGRDPGGRQFTFRSEAAHIDKDLDSAYAQIDTRASELGARVKTEAAEREPAVSEVKRRLPRVCNRRRLPGAAIRRGVARRGIFLATWAPELAKVAAGQWAEVWNSM